MTVCLSADTLVLLLETVGIFNHSVQQALATPLTLLDPNCDEKVKVINALAHELAIARSSLVLDVFCITNRNLGRDYVRAVLDPLSPPEGKVITIVATGRITFLKEVLHVLEGASSGTYLFRSAKIGAYPKIASHLRAAHYHAVQWGALLMVKVE